MNTSKKDSECQMVPLFVVYVIWCSKTNMHYIGVTGQEVWERIRQHKRDKKQFVDREIQHVGWENFDWWIVEGQETHGGIGDTIMSEDTLAKMRKGALERDIRGEKHPFYGKHHT